MKKYLFLIAFLALTNQFFAQLSPTENYVYTKTYLSEDGSKKAETVVYYDGLGRPKQIVNIKATPTGKDLVTPVTYDGFGRQVKDILPTPISSLNSAIHSGITNESTANSYYGVTNAYSEKEIENSPLDRVLQQAHAGDSWKLNSGHTQKMKYEANSANEVLKFATNTNWVNGATSSAISLVTDANSENGHFKAAQLYKTTVTDEDGNPVSQFENGRGQILLIRKTDGTQNIDTYYVYNEYNQKAFIIPPKAVKQIKANNTVTQAILDDLCYQYSYDGRNRQVERKLPGKGREYFVYDKADRLILNQDSVLKSQNKWLITKYDQFGRVVYTGFLTGGERAVRQNEISNLIITENRSSTGFTRSGINVYYTDNTFVGESPTILSVNYYNTYPADSFTPAVPASVLGQAVRPETGQGSGVSTNNLQTATYVKNIEDDNWTKTYNYYDSKARIIATKTINHLGGYTNTDRKLDFTGLVEESYTYHKRTANDTEVKVKVCI